MHGYRCSHTTTSSLFLYRFQHPFCCKTKLGGRFKGGLIPFSFFKINVTGNIYKPERLVWPVKMLSEKFNTRCLNWEVGLLDVLFLITEKISSWRKVSHPDYGSPAWPVPSRRSDSKAQRSVESGLSCLPSSLSLWICLLRSTIWTPGKTGYLAILVYFPAALDLVFRVLVKR